jgi:hypothetical protein
MSRSSITLVGRASQLVFREFESGTTRASFTLTVKGRGDRPPLVVECEGWGTKIREQFELMDEGCLVGIIGTLQRIADADTVSRIRLDRLELLGQPLAAA